MAVADLADAFTRMAERIRAIEPADFNGALVLVAPDGTEITLMMQGTRDEVVFWSTAKSKIEIAATDFAQKAAAPVFGQYR
jgi:hypothetical protein